MSRDLVAADADADVVEGRPPVSTRTPLSEERILAAAVTYLDEHGLPALTMRRLGGALGVEAMSLYRYVGSREALLDGVVVTLIDEMRVDEEVLDAPRDGWQDFLQRMAHGVRRVALRHPNAFPLVASRPAEAPWLRPPLRSLEWVQTFLEGLAQEGFDDESAAGAYRAFTSFLLGHLLLEVAGLGADIGPLDVVDEAVDPSRRTLQDFPAVAGMRGLLSQDLSAAEFEEALEALLDRITLMISSKTP